MPNPKLTVIQGGASGVRVQGTLVPTGITDQQGNPYLKATGGGEPPSGGGGDMTPIWKLDVPRDVQLLKAGFPLILAALTYLAWYVVDELKDVRKDIAVLDKSIGMQTKTIENVEKSVGRIEGKLDLTPNPPAPSPPAKQQPSGKLAAPL